MLKQTTSILLLVFLINNTCGQPQKWSKKLGVANINCPWDDDPDDPTLLPYEGDCTKFIKCSYGLGYTLSCPYGLHFAASLSQCESPKVANCNPQATTSAPVIGGGGCTFDYKPHPTDCGKAIQCIDGIETELRCPLNSKWDKVKKECSFEDNIC